MKVSMTPEGRTFAANKDSAKVTQDSIKDDDDVLSMINTAKASYEVKKSLSDVVAGIRNEINSSHPDWNEGSHIEVRIPRGSSYIIDIICKPNSGNSESSARKAIDFAADKFRQLAGLDV